MVAFNGVGGIVIIVPIVVALFVNIVTSAVFNEDNYFQAYLWPKLAALGIIGVFFWVLGRYLHSRPDQLVIDQTTGQEVEQKPCHDFMYIKIEYWGVISILIAIVLVIMRLAGK